MTQPAYQLLVIDDSARDALLLERLLRQSEEATFDVTHVTSAQAGLEAIENSSYDLVLLDYYLPDMDGLVFLQTKQSRGLTTPVIMLTAVSSLLKEHEATSSEDTDYGLGQLLKKVVRQMREDGLEKPELFLDKPVDPEDLVTRVRDLIGA